LPFSFGQKSSHPAAAAVKLEWKAAPKSATKLSAKRYLQLEK